jgi:Predicted transcriptional regulators
MREYLKDLRDAKGFTQQDVADKLNVSRQYYCFIENGSRQSNMDITLAVKLADVFSVTVESIIKNEAQADK